MIEITWRNGNYTKFLGHPSNFGLLLAYWLGSSLRTAMDSHKQVYLKPDDFCPLQTVAPFFYLCYLWHFNWNFQSILKWPLWLWVSYFTSQRPDIFRWNRFWSGTYWIMWRMIITCFFAIVYDSLQWFIFYRGQYNLRLNSGCRAETRLTESQFLLGLF